VTDDSTAVLGTKNGQLPRTGGNFGAQLLFSLGLLGLGGLLIAAAKRSPGSSARQH